MSVDDTRRRIATVLILLISVAGYFTFTFTRRSFANPGNAYNHSLPPAEVTPRFSDRVVLMLSDGLRDDVARELPNMSALGTRPDAAFHRAITGVPSLSRPGATAVLCGIGPEQSGVPLNESTQPVVGECLFGSVAAVGEESVAAGVSSGFAKRGYGPATVLPHRDLEDDHTLGIDLENRPLALEALDMTATFVYLYFPDYDSAAHETRADSQTTAEIAHIFDSIVGEVASRMDLTRETLIVTSDHGHIDEGGHGGAEYLARVSPLLMVGKGVGGGSTTDVLQTDIAPTVAGLLGVPRPRHAEGMPLLESMRGDPGDLYRLYASQTAALERKLQGDLEFLSGKPAPSGTVGALRDQIEQARWSRGVREAFVRLPAAILLALAVGVVARMAGGLRRRHFVGAGLLIFCLLVAFRLVGYKLSISFFNTPGDDLVVLGALVGGVGVGLFAGGILVGWRDRSHPWRKALGLISTIVFVCAAVSSVFLFWYGYSISWRLPDLRPGFVALFAMLVPIVACILLPVAAMGVMLAPNRRGEIE